MRSVLVADDHEVTRRGLRELIAEYFGAVDVVEAADGRGVLELVPQRAWDLVLLDVVMPETHPAELVRTVRAGLPKTPILMLTAAKEPQYAAETMRAGANGLVHKHRAATELIEAIRAVLDGESYLHPETAAELAKLEPEGVPLHESLSPRELQVLRGIAMGRSVKEIAAELEISDKTVATYQSRIREKTGLSSAVEFTRYALLNGLVD